MASKDGIGNQHEIDDFLNKVDEIGNFICEQCVRLLVGLVGFLFFFFVPTLFTQIHMAAFKSQIGHNNFHNTSTCFMQYFISSTSKTEVKNEPLHETSAK